MGSGAGETDPRSLLPNGLRSGAVDTADGGIPMTSNAARNAEIVRAALAARTPDAAAAVQSMIEAAVGGRYVRPIGDRFNNQGMLTGSGSSYDHKSLEVVTNMQDGILERYALAKWGDIDNVPYKYPRAAADDL